MVRKTARNLFFGMCLVAGVLAGSAFHAIRIEEETVKIVVATQEISKGTALTRQMYKFSDASPRALPSNPIPFDRVEYYVGKRLKHDVVLNEPLRQDSFERNE